MGDLSEDDITKILDTWNGAVVYEPINWLTDTDELAGTLKETLQRGWIGFLRVVKDALREQETLGNGFMCKM